MNDSALAPPQKDPPSTKQVETTLGAPQADAVERSFPAEATSGSVEPPPTFFGLTRSDSLFVGVIGVVLAGLLIAHWLRLTGWGMREVEIDRQPARPFESPLDLNQANWVELSQLEGVGETLARRIVEHREHQGPFTSLEELRRVKGVGVKTLEKLKPWLRIGVSAAPTSKELEP